MEESFENYMADYENRIMPTPPRNDEGLKEWLAECQKRQESNAAKIACICCGRPAPSKIVGITKFHGDPGEFPHGRWYTDGVDFICFHCAHDTGLKSDPPSVRKEYRFTGYAALSAQFHEKFPISKGLQYDED